MEDSYEASDLENDISSVQLLLTTIILPHYGGLQVLCCLSISTLLWTTSLFHSLLGTVYLISSPDGHAPWVDSMVFKVQKLGGFARDLPPRMNGTWEGRVGGDRLLWRLFVVPAASLCHIRLFYLAINFLELFGGLRGVATNTLAKKSHLM